MSIITRIKDKLGVKHEIGVKWDNVSGKPSTFAPKMHTHNFTEVQEPIAEKTYTSLIASSNTNGNGADFIMIDLAHVSDTSKIFKLRVRIEASYKRSNDNVTYTSTHDCLIYGAGGNDTICSAMWNNHRNTSYRPMYYFVAYRPSTATANWKLGVCLYNCNNNTTAGNERTITMKVISQENCSATLYDSCANTDYTTYYKNMAGRTTYDCANNGLQESGDANTTTNVYAKDITGYSGTAAGTAAKAIDFAQFVYTGSRVFKAYIANANTANTPTINVNGKGAKALYLLTADNTWTATSSTVKTITAGSHWFFWNGTCMYMLPDACDSSAIPTDVAYINGQAAYATKNVFVNGAYLVKGAHFRLRVDAVNANTGNLSLNVNCQGAKPLFINGARANGTSNNLAVSWYEVVYDGTNYNAYNAAGGGIVYPEADHASSASAAKSGSALETAINGKLDVSASNATSGTAEGIFNNSAERPDSDSYDVSSSDVVLVQDVKNGAVGLPRRTTVGRLLSNVDSNVRALANNKFDKENIVQNLNASNEDKVPSQKAVRNAVSSLDNSKQNKLPLDKDGETYNIHVQRSDIATAAQKDEDNNVIKTTYLKNENLDISSSGTFDGAFIGACISITLGDDVSSTQMNVAAIVEKRILSQYRFKCKTFHVLNLSSKDITIMGFADGSTFKLLRNRGTTIYSYREGSNYKYYRMDL